MGLRLILSAVLLLAGWQEQEQKIIPPPARPFVERNQKQFSFYPGGKLQIIAEAPGALRVTGWNRPAVLVETEKIIYRLPADQAQTLAAQFPVQVRWTQVSGMIRTLATPESKALMKINVTLYVPKDKTDLEIKILKGDLAVGGLNGWVEADLQEGSIEAKSLSGYFSASTQEGDLKVEMSGRHWDGYGFTAITRRGAAYLRLPAGYSTQLQLESRDGQMTLDYPDPIVDGEPVPLQPTEKKGARLLAAKLGGGGSAIKMSTLSGSLHLAVTAAP